MQCNAVKPGKTTLLRPAFRQVVWE